MKVTIIGTGYVGLTTGVVLAFIGHDVTCVDTNEQILAELREGRPAFYEPGLVPLLRDASTRLRFVNDVPALEGEGVVMIAVGTPPKADGEADLAYVDQAARSMAGAIRDGARLVVVNKSTVPIGGSPHVEMLVRRVLAERGVQAEVDVVSNPEFLAEGQAVQDALYPDRIVVGAQRSQAVAMMRELYAPLLEQTFESPPDTPRPERFALPPMITTSPTAAELTKYAANAFLATKISFINEFAGLAEKVGADVMQVARAIGLDDRIGPRFLQAGIGWGGSCFGKDTSAVMAIARTYDYEMPLVQATVNVNLRQRQRVVEKLQEHLKVLRGTTIGLLGVAFKQNTDDIRDAPAVTLIEALRARGAHVKVHDPMALGALARHHPDLDVEAVDDEMSLVRGCDAVVVVTDWPQYRALPLAEVAEAMSGRVLVDARNLLVPQEVRAVGLRYIGVGR